jgi:DNA-3-methyladenine glycosylase
MAGERPGAGGGVLLRAIEPLEGIEQMARSRGKASFADIGRGPGRLTRAMNVDLRQDGSDLCAHGPLWLGVTMQATGGIGKKRIGLTRKVHRLLRFYERSNPHVSGPTRLRQ